MDPKPNNKLEENTLLDEFGDDAAETSLAVVTKSFTGINIGGNTVTQSTEHLPEDQRLTLRAFYHVARESKWEKAQIEEKAGMSYNALWKILTGSYRYPLQVPEHHCPKCAKLTSATRKGNCSKCGEQVRTTYKPHPKAGQQIPLDGIIATLQKWKLKHDREQKRTANFVEISVYTRTAAVCGRAFKRKKMAFIFSDSHLGKTWSLKEFARRNNSGQTTYVEMPPSAGVQLMTRKIAQALHVSTSTCFEKLIEDVIGALDPSKLLIIDEIHRVFTTYQKTSVMRCLDVLRYIFDQTGCGMVMCGTNVFRDAMQQGDFFKYLKQLARRGVYTLQLEDQPREDDMLMIAEHRGLGVPDAKTREIIKDIAHTHGLGMFCTRVEDAVELAKGKPVTWNHFLRAHKIALQLQDPTQTEDDED